MLTNSLFNILRYPDINSVICMSDNGKGFYYIKMAKIICKQKWANSPLLNDHHKTHLFKEFLKEWQ